MITAGQFRSARALLDIDQRGLAGLSNLSVPTIRRMDAGDGVIRGQDDSLIKLVVALDAAAGHNSGRGVGLKPPSANARPGRASSKMAPARRAE